MENSQAVYLDVGGEATIWYMNTNIRYIEKNIWYMNMNIWYLDVGGEAALVADVARVHAVLLLDHSLQRVVHLNLAKGLGLRVSGFWYSVQRSGVRGSGRWSWGFGFGDQASRSKVHGCPDSGVVRADMPTVLGLRSLGLARTDMRTASLNDLAPIAPIMNSC